MMQLFKIETYHNNIIRKKEKYSFMNFNQRNGRDSNRICVKDAFIEEVFRDRDAGYVTISYGVMNEFNIIQMIIVQLLIAQDTVIQNQFGQKMLLRDLRAGMRINTEFSNVMTASEPPIARAFTITVLRERIASNVKTDRVITVDTENSFFVTGIANDINSQIRFQVSPATIILDKRGNRVCLCSIKIGQMVRVEHATFMTFSIPPQTAAYKVQIL